MKSLVKILPVWSAIVFCGQNSFAQNPGCPQSLEQELLDQFAVALIMQRDADSAPDTKTANATEPKPIYGCDDRRNVYQTDVTDSQRKAASATAILVKSNQLQMVDQSDNLNLPSDNAHLCSPKQVIEASQRNPTIPLILERFWQEPAPGFCSGFKVGSRLIATAGHCIQAEVNCKGDKSNGIPGTIFVFGFKMSSYGDRPEKNIDKNNLYQCVKLLGGSYTDQSDWRVAEVDRDIDAPQVEIHAPQQTPDLKVGTKLTIAGYPMGLPVKIAAGAVVRKIRTSYFVANLDSYGGNSGSPVFNTEYLTHGKLLVEGILVRGDEDFAQKIPCYISKHCPSEGCRGEDVTLTSEFGAVLSNK
jgi:V8-like Glu-specific endopeptidase